MNGWSHFTQTVLAFITGVTILAGGLIAYTAIKSDASGLRHNYPPIVEQQDCLPEMSGIQHCGSFANSCDNDSNPNTGTIADCVTNSGPCVWDADDTVFESPREVVTGPQCYFADRTPHDWRQYVCATSRGKGASLTMRMRFEPQGLSAEKTLTFTQHNRTQCATICAYGLQYHDFSGFPEIPYQGGGGGTLGHAVETQVHFDVETTGNFRSIGNWYAVTLQGLYCDFNLPVDLFNPAICNVGAINYGPVFCWQ